MEYWLLTTEYPPQFGGGIGTYCKQLTELCAAKGYRITVFIPNNTATSYTTKFEEGVRYVEFSPYLKNTSSFLGYETMQSYSFAEVVLDFMVKEGVPDWLEAQDYNGIAYFILQKRELGEAYYKDLKVLITCHAPSFLYFEFNHINSYKLPYFWIGEMEKFCIRAANVCISPSQYLVDRLQERLEFKRDYYVLHNPYASSSSKADHHYGQINNKAIFLAKLSPSKGILQTLKAFKQLWNSGFTFKLKLIGDESFFYHAKQSMMGKLIEEEFSHYIKKGYLEVAGILSPEKVYEELKAAHVVLVPSTVDNFPYTVLESMANKKVVLASRQGGHSEIIKDGYNGLLFDHEEEGAFVSKIKEAFDLSESQLKTIGENAAVTVNEKCDPDKYTQSKISILKEYSTDTCSSNLFKFIRDIPALGYRDLHPIGEKDLLSVVIPYYNMGSYIDNTIDSVRKSLFQNKEIIIVDDGSDKELDLKKLEELDKASDIRVISQTNKGLAEARNAGALASKGEYLAFLDADDIVLDSYFSRAVNILRAKVNVHFVGSWVQYFEGSSNIWPALQPEPPYLLYHNMVNSSGLVYKKSSFLKAGMNDKSFIYGMEDYDSVISMVKNGLMGVVIPDVLFYYRVRKGSMARGFNDSNKSYLYKLIAEKHKAFYSNFASEISNLLNANGPGFKVENPTMDYHLYATDSLMSKIIYKSYNKLKHLSLIRILALRIYRSIK